MSTKRNTKRLTVCAMLSALGVVVLYMGAIFEVLDISLTIVASLICTLVVIEYGGKAAWTVWGVTALLSLLLLPNKFPALMYTLFFGFYPIIKENLERIRQKVIQWAIKLVIFNAAILLLVLVAKLFVIEMPDGFALKIAFFALANLTMFLYDVVLTRIISLYVFRFRKRFKKMF